VRQAEIKIILASSVPRYSPHFDDSTDTSPSLGPADSASEFRVSLAKFRNLCGLRPHPRAP
jgi:hypothetical protein